MSSEFRQCEHGYHHPDWAHACDGCWCHYSVDTNDLVTYYEGLARDEPKRAKHWMREADRAREYGRSTSKDE